MGTGNARFVALAASTWWSLPTREALRAPLRSHAINGMPGGTFKLCRVFYLFLPVAVNYLIPATAMYFAVPQGGPRRRMIGAASTKWGGRCVMLLFAAALGTAIAFQQCAGLSAAVGMMTGLAYLQFFAYYLKPTHHAVRTTKELASEPISSISWRAEWDTLLLFYVVILCI